MASLFANSAPPCFPVTTPCARATHVGRHAIDTKHDELFFTELETFCKEQDELTRQAIADLDAAFEDVRSTKGSKAKEAAKQSVKESLLEVDSSATKIQVPAIRIVSRVFVSFCMCFVRVLSLCYKSLFIPRGMSGERANTKDVAK